MSGDFSSGQDSLVVGPFQTDDGAIKIWLNGVYLDTDQESLMLRVRKNGAASPDGGSNDYDFECQLIEPQGSAVTGQEGRTEIVLNYDISAANKLSNTASQRYNVEITIYEPMNPDYDTQLHYDGKQHRTDDVDQRLVGGGRRTAAQDDVEVTIQPTNGAKFQAGSYLAYRYKK
jgi:hypothetical protein